MMLKLRITLDTKAGDAMANKFMFIPFDKIVIS